MPNVYLRIIIGVILSVAILLGTFYFATIVEGGISPVPSLLLICVIWLVLFWDKRDRSGRDGGTMGN